MAVMQPGYTGTDAPAPAPNIAPPSPPTGAVPGQGKAPGGLNPVATAVETLVTFISAQQEQGNPKASGMMSALQQLVTTMTGQAPEAPGMKPPAPTGPNKIPAPSPKGPGSGMPSAGPRTVNPNIGAARAMAPSTGAVPVL